MAVPSITIPEPSLVILVGISGSGKSTFAYRHFRSTEIVASDHLRAMVSDTETDLAASADAFATLRFIAGRRLKRGKLTVIDATNVGSSSRKPLLTLARSHGVPCVALVFVLPLELCLARNAAAGGKRLDESVLRQQGADLRRSLLRIPGEGFDETHVFDSESAVAGAVLARRPAGAPTPSPQGELEF